MNYRRYIALFSLLAAHTFLQSMSWGAQLLKEQLRCAPSPVDQQPVCDVSMIEVIANPDIWDGKRVRLIGFMHLEFESNGLYLGKSDFEIGLSKNGLWIDTESSRVPLETLSKCAGDYALVEGVFRSGPSGHFGMWSGEMTQIIRCMEWRPRTPGSSRRPRTGPTEPKR